MLLEATQRLWGGGGGGTSQKLAPPPPPQASSWRPPGCYPIYAYIHVPYMDLCTTMTEYTEKGQTQYNRCAKTRYHAHVLLGTYHLKVHSVICL